jgi:uncharacterized damage-inducible protein DinB
MTSVALELYRHKTWATLRLIELLRELPQDLLDETTPGTFGSIRETLRHIANNDAGYYALVTQQPDPEPLPDEPSLDQVATLIQRVAPRWEKLLEDPKLPDRLLGDATGTAPAVVPMAQVVHHSDVHRAHILSVLGARGIEVPELDLWEYGAAAGYVRGTGG